MQPGCRGVSGRPARSVGRVARRHRRVACATHAKQLPPLRGEGVAADALGNSTGRTAFCHRSISHSSNAETNVRLATRPRRAPSPLKGERAGVRGETVARPSPATNSEAPQPFGHRHDGVRVRPADLAGASLAGAFRATLRSHPDLRRKMGPQPEPQGGISLGQRELPGFQAPPQSRSQPRGDPDLDGRT